MMIEVKTQNSVAVIKLNNSVTNALNLELIIELGNTLKRLKSDPDVSGLVLGSTNDKFFSIGFDIPKLIDLSRKDFQTFYRSFNQTCLNLYTIPKPTLASITGHAVAGGCIITLCCDYRFIAEGRKLMGLNEIKLGVPVPYLADCITRTLLGEKTARDVMETGEFYSTEKLMQTGMVDEVIPAEELEKESIEKVRYVGSMPHEAYKVIKQNRIDSITNNFLKYSEEREETFIKCWYSDKTQKLLKEAIEKF